MDVGRCACLKELIAYDCVLEGAVPAGVPVDVPVDVPADVPVDVPVGAPVDELVDVPVGAPVGELVDTTGYVTVVHPGSEEAVVDGNQVSAHEQQADDKRCGLPDTLDTYYDVQGREGAVHFPLRE